MVICTLFIGSKFSDHEMISLDEITFIKPAKGIKKKFCLEYKAK